MEQVDLTLARARIQTRVHTRMHAYAYTFTRTHTRTHVLAHSQTHIRTNTYKHTQTSTDAHQEKRFSCFLSHYKHEAGTEARLVKDRLAPHVNKDLFLDSGNTRVVRQRVFVAIYFCIFGFCLVHFILISMLRSPRKHKFHCYFCLFVF